MNKFESILKLTKDYPIASIGTLVLAGVSIFVKYKTHHDDVMKNMPDSYWEAKKAEEISKKEAEAERTRRDIALEKIGNQHRLEKQKMENDESFRIRKEQHEFEKSLPDSYWAYKAAVEERAATENAAKESAKALKYAADKGYDTDNAKSFYATDLEKSKYQEMRKMAEAFMNSSKEKKDEDKDS